MLKYILDPYVACDDTITILRVADVVFPNVVDLFWILGMRWG